VTQSAGSTGAVGITIMSVRLSVHLSVTFRYFIATTQHDVTVSLQHVSPIILILWVYEYQTSLRSHPERGAKYRSGI